MATLTGMDALDYAEENGLTLSTEDREGLSVDEARALAKKKKLFLEVDDDDLTRLTDMGGYRVFHKAWSENADSFRGGPWFFEPVDWDTSEVYSSRGYPTMEEAMAKATEKEDSASESGAPDDYAGEDN